MAEYVEKGVLHETIAKLEKLARDRYCDTPWDSPVRTRYREQLNERTNLKHLIFDLPAADVAPVRHGRWIMRGGKFRCSECDAKANWKREGGTGGFSFEYEQIKSTYCHNCGAKMDGDSDG